MKGGEGIIAIGLLTLSWAVVLFFGGLFARLCWEVILMGWNIL